MREYVSKIQSEKNTIKSSICIFHIIFLVVLFSMGGLLYKIIPKFLNNITILNTFFLISFLYVFQILIEGLRFTILCIKKLNNEKLAFKKLLKSKFLIINFVLFMCLLASIFVFSLSALFFSNFKILFMIFCGVILSILYLFYTIEISKLVDEGFEKYNFQFLKNRIYDFTILILIDTLIIIFPMIIFGLIQNHYILIVVGIVLLNLILYSFNRACMRNKISNN